MRIYLHIGVWKTGSTAIQTFLCKNAHALSDQGVLIPEYARDMSKYNHLFERLIQKDEAGIGQISDSLAADIDKFDPEVLIVSSEHFWHAPPDAIERVAALLRKFSDDIRIIAYIRPQDDMWASLYAQQAKFFRVRSEHSIWGGGDYIGPAIAENAMYYYHCFAEYQRVFGQDSIELKVYERKSFPDGDVVQDFLTWIGVADNRDFVASESDENSSFGWKGVAFSIWLADRLHAGEAFFENTRGAGKALRFAMRDTGRKFGDIAWYGKAPECFGPEERRRIRAHYAADYDALTETYFGGRPPFRDPSERPADPFDFDLIPTAEIAFAKRRLRKRIARTYPILSRDRWFLKSE